MLSGPVGESDAEKPYLALATFCDSNFTYIIFRSQLYLLIANLVLLRRPGGCGDGGLEEGLVTGLVAGAGPLARHDLVEDGGHAGGGGGVGEVADGAPQPRVVNIQVQGVETPAVLHYGVQHAEPRALLQKQCAILPPFKRFNG